MQVGLRKICLDQSDSETIPHLESGLGSKLLDIYQIQEYKEGLLWLCTSNGLFVFDKKQRKIVAHYQEGSQAEYHLPANHIFLLYTDSDGNRWLGTPSGLLLWNPKTNEKRLFTRNDGLSNNVIYAIYEDDYNRLWLSSDYGIMSFDKETFDVQTYLPKNGIAQEEFNRISHFQESDGTIYFGGLNGVTTFHPKDFVEKKKDYAGVVISDFEIFDGAEEKLVNKLKEITETQTITFHPNDRYFRLKFALPTFEETSKILYGWKVEGVDSDWNYQKENSIQIGILPYGNHTLRIKGQSGGGWSPHELAIKVNVLKPFYLQTWFLIMASLIFLISGPLFLKWRLRQHKARQQVLEKEIEKATAQIQNDKETIEIQAKELRELDKMKSRFFANVSHELRTPLTLMLGPISSAIKRGKLDNRDFTLLIKAQQSGKDLFKLIRSILDLSKMESGKMTLNETPELFFKFVRRIVSSFESHAQREGIYFEFNYYAEQDLQLNFDKGKLEVILNNLLSNAIKFTPKDGKITVNIEDLANRIKITVADTGCGIHPDDLPNIFNRFYQSSQPDAPTEGGTGIGLALSQEFVNLMNGKIWVESDLEVGSRFFVGLPRKEVLGSLEVTSSSEGYEGRQEGVISKKDFEMAEMTPSALASNHAHEDVIPSGRDRLSTILIVEDNHSLRDYLETILSPHYNVLTAENGQVALDLLNSPPGPLKGELPPTASETSFGTAGGDSPLGAGGKGGNGGATADCQLILSDIMMPVMDGYQLLEKLKSDDRFRHLPVIMLTARADIQDKLKALRIGVDDYILKPFVEEELLARIENLLQNYQERVAQVSDNSEESDTSSTTPTISKEDQEWLADLETHLQKQLSNSQYSISQLAHDLAISERQLRRRIKQLIGLSPAQYFKAIRLQYARQLLEQKTYKTIAQTAAAVGFQDAGAFSRNFLHRFAKSPSDYLND